MSRRHRRLSAGLFFLFAGLPLLDVGLFGFRRIFRYLASDSYYYLTVAINFPAAGFFTFDQSLPTNGFHPMWQALLAAASYPVGVLAEPRAALLVVAFGGSLVLAGAGVLLAVHRVLPRLGGADFLVLLIPPGVTALVGAWYHPRFSALWHQINGMESGLALFFFGAFVHLALASDGPRRPWIRSGLVLGLLVLSRLDLVFLLPALAGVGLLEVRAAAVRRPLVAGYLQTLGIASLLIAVYVAINLATLGEPLPVSSRFKTHFPSIYFPNLVSLQTLWQHFTAPSQTTVALSGRIVLNLVPLVVALPEAWRGCRLVARGEAPDAWRRLLAVLALFLCGLHLYNLLFVRFIAQGTWYYAVSQLAASLIVIAWLTRSARFQALVAPRRILALVACAVVSTTFFVAVHLAREPIGRRALADPEDYEARYYFTFSDRRDAQRFYGGSPPRIVEFDDGIVAYSLGAPAMSGFGYCLDPEGAERLLEDLRSLLPLAWDRGFDRLAASYYMNYPLLYARAPDDQVTAFLHRIHYIEDLRPFRWHVEYVSPHRTFYVLRFTPLAADGVAPRPASVGPTRPPPGASAAAGRPTKIE